MISTFGAAALQLSQEYGLAVFLLRPRGKKPLVPKLLGGRGYLDASSHAEQVAAWWDLHPDANIGAVPGSIGAVVVDLDGDAAREILGPLGVYDVATCETITARGSHRWFRLPSGVIVGNIARDDLDIRSTAGYVVVPPSIHPDGPTYEWRGSLDTIAVAPAPFIHWLERNGKRENAEESTVVRHPPQHYPAPSGLFDRRSEARVLAYAARMGYGLADGRKTSAFRFAAFLHHDCELTPDIVLRYVQAWNSENSPPLTDSLVVTITKNAATYGGRRGAA